MTDPYATTPLNFASSEFRLLRVQPGDVDSIVKCTLQTFPLGDHPPYTALSYTWGRDQTYDLIEINGVPFPARENLWTFLQRRRQREEYAWLWVDAVCINQSKVLELNHQVQMMRHIYGGAESVSIWLGSAHSHSDDVMQRLSDGVGYPKKSLTSTQSETAAVWTRHEGQGMLSLFTRQYWRRMWVIQEVLLAKHVVVHCGAHSAAWEMLNEVYDHLRTVKKRALELYTPFAHAMLASPAMALVKCKTEWTAERPPLRVLIRNYASHESTDIRDKVYALIGIADDASDLLVDYNKTTKDVLIHVLRHASERLGNGQSQAARRKVELIRLNLALQKVLKVKVTESEVQSNIESIWNRTYRTPRSCLFAFLSCPFKTHSQQMWKEHCLAHFGHREPPRSIHCHRCDLPKTSFESGWDAWKHKLDNSNSHLEEGEVEEPRPDHYLLEHLWQKGLIDDLDLEELLVGQYCLALPPRSRTNWTNLDRVAWEGHEENCQDKTCREVLQRPILKPLDDFHDHTWDGTLDTSPRAGVIDPVLEHIATAEAAYRDWHEKHSHQTPAW